MKKAKRTKRASRRKYHYIYKTTCVITNKFYIGMHSTDNLEDGYIGSGKRLWYSINKHGKDNHICEILEFLPDRNSLKAREKEIVNEELIGEELCMNLQLGGVGGFINEEHRKKASDGFIKKLKTDKEFSEKWSKRMSNLAKHTHSFGKLKSGKDICDWNGRKHSPETIIKMRESKKNHGCGSKNSQYGTRWINNGIEAKKIKKDDSIPEGWKLGRRIK